MLSTTEGTHLPVHARMAARMHRNAFRLNFAHNNATARLSNFNNMASKNLYCLQIPRQISSRKQLDQDKGLGLQALKKIIFSNCPHEAFKTRMSPSLTHSLIFSTYTLGQEVKCTRLLCFAQYKLHLVG